MNKFKLARMRAGLTQLAVARHVGVSESKICRIETGRMCPDPILRQKLAALLKCAITELFPQGHSKEGSTNE